MKNAILGAALACVAAFGALVAIGRVEVRWSDSSSPQMREIGQVELFQDGDFVSNQKDEIDQINFRMIDMLIHDIVDGKAQIHQLYILLNWTLQEEDHKNRIGVRLIELKD